MSTQLTKKIKKFIKQYNKPVMSPGQAGSYYRSRGGGINLNFVSISIIFVILPVPVVFALDRIEIELFYKIERILVYISASHYIIVVFLFLRFLYVVGKKYKIDWSSGPGMDYLMKYKLFRYVSLPSAYIIFLVGWFLWANVFHLMSAHPGVEHVQVVEWGRKDEFGCLRVTVASTKLGRGSTSVCVDEGTSLPFSIGDSLAVFGDKSKLGISFESFTVFGLEQPE